MVSGAVLTAVRIVVDTDFHKEAVLQGLGILGLDSEVGGVVGPVGSDGHETLAGVLVTGGGDNDLTLSLSVVGSGVTENCPLTLAGRGGGESHHGNHGDDHDHGDDKCDQLFHVEKTPFKIFHA